MCTPKIILNFFLIIGIIFSIMQPIAVTNETKAGKRSFTIDYDLNTFMKDGKPFRFISGSFHYFRSVPGSWQRKLMAMKAAGLNAVSTFVEWSLHNLREEIYNWNGMADIEKFLTLAKEENLLVILRPGPYISAGRDMGGFPYWLLRKYPNINLRTTDENFKTEVQKWWNVLMPKLEPYLYGNGGPIIMVQIENEYGSLGDCDHKYREWLANITEKFVQDKAVLYTNDGVSLGKIQCGHTKGILSTIHLDPGDDHEHALNQLRNVQPNGPFVNSEFYTGGTTHWQKKKQKVDTDLIIRTLTDILDDGANVNLYMFYGGTNFGFTSGANDDGPGKYDSDTTSNDFNAPLDESGDPTPKYMALREMILRYLPFSNISTPKITHKEAYGTVNLKSIGCILSPKGRKYLSEGEIFSEKPLTFEALDQNSGLVLYETKFPYLKTDPSLLQIDKIRDRAQIFIDDEYVGLLSRENNITTCPVIAQSGTILQILVENQGRINTNVRNDLKGILGDVLIQGNPLRSWHMTKYPFDNYEKIENYIQSNDIHDCPATYNKLLRNGPKVFHGALWINGYITYDTYLDPTGWGKGIVFINGFNLGRYWPTVGPQITLYVPKEILKPGSNSIVFIEYEKVPSSGDIKFVNVHDLDGIQKIEF